MSPAPVRTRAATAQKFPHAWGYWVGLMFIVGGIVLAVFMVVSGIRGFTSDVNDLRRAFDGNLETNLRAGEEVIVYDETDVGIGPFDVTVIRTSDGSEVATKPADAGTTYDIDGRSGEARVAFRVPTSDIYRVEVDTSVGQLARFAVGGDIGNSRANTITSGLLWGGLMVLVGIATIIATMLVHARWRVRHALADQVAAARSTLSTASEAVTTQAERAAGEGSAWARQTVERARESLPQSSGASSEHGRAPTWRESLEAQARERLDKVEQRLSAAEPAVAEATSTPEAAQDLVSRIDEALGRVGERVQAGDSLRDIARDERAAARDTAQEFSERARAGTENVAARAQEIREAAVAAGTEQVQGLADDLSLVATTAMDEAVAQTEAGVDELAVGLAATATGAVAAATEAGVARARDVVGTQTPTEGEAPGAPPQPVISSLPVPPSSTLPVPPSSTLPAPPSPALPQPPASVPAAADPSTAPPAPPEPPPSVPAPVEAEPGAVRDFATAPAARQSFVLAPPPAAGRLAPPPSSPAARTPSPAGAADAEPEAPSAPFAALAPPPAAAKPLRQPDRGAAEDAAGTADTQSPATGDTPASEPSAEPPGRPRAFSLAPPPDYGSLTSR